MDPSIPFFATSVALKVLVAMFRGGKGVAGEQDKVPGGAVIAGTGLSLGEGAHSILEMIADVGKDTIWLRTEKHLIERLRSPGEALHNHHLTTAVGKSIKLVILKSSKEDVFSEYKSELEKIAAAAPDFWAALSAADKPELAPLTRRHQHTR